MVDIDQPVHGNGQPRFLRYLPYDRLARMLVNLAIPGRKIPAMQERRLGSLEQQVAFRFDDGPSSDMELS
jgi:hypothetical protein